jgi:hypothetical protein
MKNRWICFFCVLSFPILFLSCEPTFSLPTICRGTIKNGVCNINNRGTVNINNYYNNIINPSEDIITNTASFKAEDVVVGNLRFKLLGCNAREERVKCDIQVTNPTTLDRTLFVMSQQLSGIRDMSLANLGVTTMIDGNGASYSAKSVSFANQSGNETGQSYFTVYSNIPTKLSVYFTGVENPATVRRLDLLIGEQKSSGLLYDRIKYPVKPKQG